MKKYFIGIDISKKTLDISIYDKVQSLPDNYLHVSNDLPGFKLFAKWLRQKRLKFSDIVVCMEHTGIYGLDISFFLESVNIDYCLVSGLVICRSLGLLRGKDDKIDSYRISRYCYLHREELTYYKVPSACFLQLRDLMAERRGYVKRQAQCKIWLTEHKATGSEASVSRFTGDLKLMESFIKAVEKEALVLLMSDESLSKNYFLLTSIVGVSFVNAVNVILYTSNFTFTVNARSYACYCGIAPFEYQSGTSIHRPARVSKMANMQLKSDLSQAAISAVTHDPELKVYYTRKLSSGKAAGVVLNAVKFKLVERMFSVVKRGTPYVKLGGYASSICV